MIGFGINLVMTVIGFAVSTMFIVFVCTRLICARIQLNASRRSFPTASSSRSDLNMVELGFQGLHGLEPAAVANIPTKKYSDEYFTSTEDSHCTVCLVEYLDEDILRILPYCGHFFHEGCIDVWLQLQSTCPVCRISLREAPERKNLMQPIFSNAIGTQYLMGSLSAHNHLHLLADLDHGLSNRNHDHHRMDPIQENQLPPDVDATLAGESFSTLSEGDGVTKDSGNKLVESPSNS